MQSKSDSNSESIDTNFRFKFGKNWRKFVGIITEERVEIAMNSLKELLNLETLSGKTFIDIGCGSGIFSLAAIKLGAKKVVSIDYDLESVNCAKYLNDKYGPFENWTVQQGSILNKDYIASLGKFDFVYSWGVLHHTGNMWMALDNVSLLVRDDGVLAISIYNDQGLISRFWTVVKFIYNKSPGFVQWLLGNTFFLLWAILMLATDIATGRPVSDRYKGANARGMNAYYDAIDWIGGYPFEVATPANLFAFYKKKGFKLERLVTRQGMGCNEFVFSK